jgi:hypothetical protein
MVSYSRTKTVRLLSGEIAIRRFPDRRITTHLVDSYVANEPYRLHAVRAQRRRCGTLTGDRSNRLLGGIDISRRNYRSVRTILENPGDRTIRQLERLRIHNHSR